MNRFAFVFFKNSSEKYVHGLFLICAFATTLVTFAIILSIVFNAVKFFDAVPLTEFLFGTHWSPHNADIGNTQGNFGMIPLMWGSIMITLLALFFGGPIGLFSGIYTALYASSRTRSLIKPILEVLAGFPTIVYGFFALMVIAPFVQKAGTALGVSASTESALVAGFVMGIMIVPFISSLTDSVLFSLPKSLRDSSLGLGATYEETICRILLPTAFPGIASGFLLAISRAIGETTLVLMTAGMHANLTLSPLEPVTTVTVQIVALLTGDQEFDSPRTLAAFALALSLFMITFIFNCIAFRIVKQYKKNHEFH